MTRRSLAILLTPLVLLAWGCQGEEKKTPEKVYEPPKLRSETERAARSGPLKSTDVRVAIRMTKDEVEEIQGKPESVDVMTYPGSSEIIERWRYPAVKNGCGLILFTNGKVTLLRNCVGQANTQPKSG